MRSITREEIERFVRDVLVIRGPDTVRPYPPLGDLIRQREVVIKKIVDRWWKTIEDPFQTKTEPPTYEEYLNMLPDSDRWAHCMNHVPHHAHTHTIVFNEGPYPDQVCVGTPHGLRYGV